jgi:membrane-bound lytic murein transglycosylase D
MKILVSSILLLLLNQAIFAQYDFLKTQENIFAQSETQWLADELLKTNPSHFKCDSPSNSWKLPQAGTFNLFNEQVTLEETDIRLFQNLMFPQGTCNRYLKLVAFCDLYFPLFRKYVDAKNMNKDYILLPLLLSGCNQNYVGSTDLAGLWAMDYLSARKYHLRIDTLVDERKGGDFSVDAALNYLYDLESRYNNNPINTITAYHFGAPFLKSLLAENNNTSILTSGPKDLQLFFKFYAYCIKLIEGTRTTNQLNTCFDIFGQMDMIWVEKPTRIEALEKVLLVNSKEIRHNNPVYTGQFIDPNYKRVPFAIDKVASLKFEVFKDSIYNWQPNPPAAIVDSEYETEDHIISYKVKKGDSLGKIAAKYDVTIKQIKSWNKIKGDKISKGQTLKIHTQRKIRKPRQEQESNPQPKADTPKIEATQSSDSTASNSKMVAEYLASGDTYLKQKKYESASKEYNKALTIDPENDHARKKLNEIKALKSDDKPAKNKVTYVVKSGDSLWKIAKKYKGVTEADIMKWNKCGENIKPGQKLVIYPPK